MSDQGISRTERSAIAAALTLFAERMEPGESISMWIRYEKINFGMHKEGPVGRNVLHRGVTIPRSEVVAAEYPHDLVETRMTGLIDEIRVACSVVDGGA